MTSCTTNDELLWDYLHDLLDAAQANQLEAHLAGCAACRQALHVAKADCASLAAATLLDGPFPLFEVPDETATRVLKSGWAAGSHWPWAAAAAVLFAVGLPFVGYQTGSLRRARVFEQTQSDLSASRQQRVNFRDRIEREQAVAVNELQTKHPRLQVHGPADFQLSQANVFRVQTTDLAGHPVPSQVTARVADEKSGNKLFERQMKSDGDLQVALPPLPLTPGSKAQVEFVAHASPGVDSTIGDKLETPEKVQGILEVQPAPHATDLALEKNHYQPGDRIFFRSITLDRSSWRPDASPFAIKFELKAPDGRVVATLSGMTRDGGIGGGDFGLPADAKSGVYKLTAAEADGRFAPVTRLVRVASGPMPPPRLADILFFPEGGNLVADIPTRVYFSARGSADEPVELEGVILDGSRREVGTIQSAALAGKPQLGGGRGFFTLTPKKSERYFVRVKNTAANEPLYALPPVHDAGLGLALSSASVIRPNEEIRATIYAVGEETPVVVGIFSHGRLLAEHPATLHAGANALALPAPADLAGVYRVALFPAQAGAYPPLAERLGYCRAERGLPVAWETATKDGKRIVKIRSGAGTPEKSWFAVSLQPAEDALMLDRAAGNGLWSGLVLRQDLRRSWPEDNLGALLRDEPAMAEALSLYLALQGPEPRPMPARDQRAQLAQAGGPRPGGESVAVLNLDNVDGVRAKFAAALTSRLATVQAQERTLADQEEMAQSRSTAARLELEAYKERAAALFRPLLGLLVVSLFAIACIGLTMAIWRMVNSREGGRNWVLASCGSLAACLVMVALAPLQLDGLPGARELEPLADLAFKGPSSATQIAMEKESPLRNPVWRLGGVLPQPIVDRSKTLPVSTAQSKSIWLPAIASSDGACEVELTAPPGKLGYILHIDVFTASGRAGSTTALLK